MLTSSELGQLLSAFPRMPYAKGHTPLDPSPNLTRILHGPHVWIKRDDQIGPGLGGNKGRSLSYLMAEVQKQGKRKVATFGGLQSNHMRITAACCAQMGLEAHLFYFEKRPDELQGNLLLCDLFGSRMHFVPVGGGSDGSLTIETASFLVRAFSLLRIGPGAFFIPVGGHSVTGCLGYVEAALELNDQIVAKGLPLENVTLVIPCGTGGTLAGLMTGFHLLNSPIRMLGIDIGRLWRRFPASIARLSNKLCQALGQPTSFSEKNVPLIEHIYANPGYAGYANSVGEAIKSMAQHEGILLDPVYTAKAFAGLLDLSAKGYFSANSHVIFLHTGGLPGLWAYSEQLIN